MCAVFYVRCYFLTHVFLLNMSSSFFEKLLRDKIDKMKSCDEEDKELTSNYLLANNEREIFLQNLF